MNKYDLISLVEDAQEDLRECISKLEEVLRNFKDNELEHYILPSLKIRVDEGHSYLTRDSNLDNIIENIKRKFDPENEDDEDMPRRKKNSPDNESKASKTASKILGEGIGYPGDEDLEDDPNEDDTFCPYCDLPMRGESDETFQCSRCRRTFNAEDLSGVFDRDKYEKKHESFDNPHGKNTGTDWSKVEKFIDSRITELHKSRTLPNVEELSLEVTNKFPELGIMEAIELVKERIEAR